jgi:alkylation response protein AidB-like acyl-CoA dehydrogenase
MVVQQRNEKHTSPLAMAAALGPEILACADAIECERQLPPSLVDAMTAAGLFKLSVPQTLGGTEADPATLVRVIEEVSRADGSTGWCLMIAIQAGMFAAFLPPAGAQMIYTDPRAYVAGVEHPVGRAQIVDRGYRVTGRWKYASGCRHATWLLGASVVYEGDTPHMSAEGKPENRWMLFPAAECEIIDTWHVSGLRGTGSHDFTVADTFVPAERTSAWMLGRPKAGADPSAPASALYAFGASLMPITVAAVPLGIARGALDAFIALVSGPGGTKGHLRESPMTHSQLGQAEAQLRAARAFLYESIAAGWESVQRTGEIPQETRQLIQLAARHVAITAAQVVEALWYATGAAAIFESNPLERRFRDAHVAAQRISPTVYARAGQLWLGIESST